MANAQSRGQPGTHKPTVGVFGLTGCAGDQLAVLNCEDELLSMVELLDIRDFLTASSDTDQQSPLDIAFVEGAVMSRRDEEIVRKIPARCETLVALGTCAVWGGIPAMDRAVDREALPAPHRQQASKPASGVVVEGVSRGVPSGATTLRNA